MGHSINLDQYILKALLNYVPMILVVIKPTGEILDLQGNQIPSKEGMDLIGENLFELFPQIKTKLDPLFDSHASIEFRFEWENGEEKRVFENYAFCIQCEEVSDAMGVIASFDITQDAILQTRLNQRSNELKAIFDAIPDLYFRLDASGVTLDYKSSSVAEHYTPPDLFLGKPVTSFFPQRLSRKIQESIEDVNKTRKLVTLEYEIPLGTESRYFEGRFFPLEKSEIILIVREVTDRILSQKKILEKERLLLETQKVAKVFSWFYNIKEDKISCTDEFFNIAEIEPQQSEFNIDYFVPFVHPDDLESVRTAMEIALETGQNLKMEFRFITKNKKMKYLSTEAKINLDKKGRPETAIGLAQDITQRKQYELELLTQKKELQSLLNNIEGIVSNQTTEVILAKEKAEMASQAKSLFLANISHELKTPIHAIMSFAELGREKVRTAKSEKLEEYFSIIHDSGRRLYDLMSNVLDLSKMETGKESYDFQRENLYALCLEVVQEMEGFLNKHHLKVQMPTPDFSCVAELDRSKILQVIRNLLSNAIRFSKPGGMIEIQINSGEYTFPSLDYPVRAIGLKVRDYGSGLDVSEKEVIFEKFRQGKMIKAGTGGTGLGLSISKEIILGHDGIIYADNHPSGGAEFNFLIPRERVRQVYRS